MSRRQNDPITAGAAGAGHPNGTVLVGVDGSPASGRALDWATDEAMRRGFTVQVMHVVMEPSAYLRLSAKTAATVNETLRRQSDDLVGAAVARVRRRSRERAEEETGEQGTGQRTGTGASAPPVPVSGLVRSGYVGPTLAAESTRVEQLVIGDRGRGGFPSLRLGSVGLHLANHASCPVVVVRGEHHPHGPVTVGVDGSTLSLPGIRFAFEEAAVHGLPVHAVHSWMFPVDEWQGPVQPLDEELGEIEALERRQLTDSVAVGRREFPHVAYTEELVRRDPTHALVDASTRAALMVVGTRGRGGFSGLLLGSVSHGVLHHAACPVVIVPGNREQPHGRHRVTGRRRASAA